jgi:hypothetical protein
MRQVLNVTLLGLIVAGCVSGPASTPTVVSSGPTAAATAVPTPTLAVSVESLVPRPSVQPASPTSAPTAFPTPPSPIPVPATTPAVDCVNPPPDIAALSDQADPVACYGNAPLTLGAYPVAVVVDCVPVEPAWLGCPSTQLMLVGETRKVGAPFLLVAVDPASGISISEHFYTNIRITGHYDDPAALTCRETGGSPAMGTPEPKAATIERCRRTFVVTRVVPLGP